MQVVRTVACSAAPQFGDTIRLVKRPLRCSGGSWFLKPSFFSWLFYQLKKLPTLSSPVGQEYVWESSPKSHDWSCSACEWSTTLHMLYPQKAQYVTYTNKRGEESSCHLKKLHPSIMTIHMCSTDILVFRKRKKTIKKNIYYRIKNY